MTTPGDRYAVCEGVLRQGSFAADVEVVTAAGIAAIGVDHDAIDAIGVEEAARVLERAGVRASSYMTLPDVIGADGSHASLDETARRLDATARLGAPAALVGTGPLGDLSLEDAEAACRRWFERAAPLAVDRGVRIMLEPMHPLMRRWSFVHSLRDAIALVGGIPGAGVVLDVGHVWWEHGLLDTIRQHVDMIASVQVTNVDPVALEEIRYERAPIAEGDVPVAAIVGVLETAGYRGWYEDETLARIPRAARLDMLRASRAWFAAL